MTPEQFLELTRVLPEPLLLLTSEGNILATNPPVAELLGLRSKDLVGKKLFDLVTESPDKVSKYLQACSSTRKMFLGSLTLRRHDTEALICRSEGALIQRGEQESQSLILLRLENRALASSNFILLNKKIDELAKEIQQRQRAEEALSIINQELERRVEERTDELTQTLNELRQTQAQLVQREKMSSLEQVVGGIAHEINNPINFIHGNLIYASQYVHKLLELLHLYQSQFPQATPEIQKMAEEIDLKFLLEDMPKLLDSMRGGTTRIDEIVQSLRTFSRLDEAERKQVDLHESIDSTLMILGNRLKANSKRPAIEVIKMYGNLPLVECYAGQLNQVFMNILVNAIDAHEEKKALCSIPNAQFSTPTIRICTEVNDHDWVTVQISDNGIGMTEAVQQKLFDPFFTTKSVGKGKGLGLSISYQIVTEKHQGKLWCSSAPGQGSEFVIEIPTRLVVCQPKSDKSV